MVMSGKGMSAVLILWGDCHDSLGSLEEWVLLGVSQGSHGEALVTQCPVGICWVAVGPGR